MQGAPKVRTFLLEKGPGVRRYILLTIVIGVPVLFLRTGQDPFNVPKLALMTAGVALAGTLRLAEALQGRSLEPVKRLFVPAAAIAGPLLVAWLFSSYKGWALLGKYGRFQGLLPYLLVIAVGFLLVDTFEDRPKQLAWAIVVAGSFVAFYGIVQFLGADPFKWAFPDRLTTQSLSTLGNSNFAGGFLGITLPLAIGLALVDQRKRGRAVRLSILILLGLLASRSEGGWAAALAGTATLVGFWASWRWSYAKMLGAVAAVLAIAALLAVGVYSILRPDNTLVPETLKLRAWWWQEAARMAGDAPIVGHGPNAFAIEVWQYRVVPEAEATHYAAADDPHSVPFSLLAAAGVVGLTGFLTVFGWVAWQARKLQPPDLLAAAFLGGIVAYFVQSFLSIDELSLRVGLWTVLAGFVASRVPAQKGVPANKKRRKTAASTKKRIRVEPLRAPVVVALLAVVAAAGLAWSAGLLLADRRYLRGNQLFASGQPDAASREYELALGFRDEYEMRHTYGFHIGDTGVALEDESYIDESRRVFSYLEDFPDVSAIRDYARVMRQWSGIEPDADPEAEALYERAAQLDQQNPRLQEEAANVLGE
jgi:O-antigen ligase